MPLVFFTAPNDPRTLATVDAIRKPFAHGGLAADGLVYRYDWRTTADGFDSDEGTFNMCSFWLVKRYARGRTDAGRLDDARLRFEQSSATRTTWGSTPNRRARAGSDGNFPQAFTHLALISAAFNLDRVLGGAD